MRRNFAEVLKNGKIDIKKEYKLSFKKPISIKIKTKVKEWVNNL